LLILLKKQNLYDIQIILRSLHGGLK